MAQAPKQSVHDLSHQWFWENNENDSCADEILYPVNNAVVPLKCKWQLAIDSSVLSTALESSLASTRSPAVREDDNISFITQKGQEQHSKRDPRYYIADELLQTEKNHVSILTTIVKVFKEPLECPTLRGGPILSPEDVKGIFGNIADIMDVHKEIQECLEERVSTWTEQARIGPVFNDQANKFLKVYPPFVNFFEMSKKTLHRCDKQYPRFHAFLKANESKAECLRQSLEELLITPIQRIPRIILLLQDLLKHTPKVHPDHKSLIEVVEVIKSTLVNINEVKRKTEKQMLLFEVVKEIEDCPANILSSTRSFIRKFEVIGIGADTTCTGGPITMFLFSDIIEIAKRKCPLMFGKETNKMYKHIELVSFQYVRSVVNFIQDKSGADLFGLLVHYPEDLREKLLVFQLPSSEGMVTKEGLLTELCSLIADSNDSPDTAQFLVTALSPGTTGKTETIKLKKAIHGVRKRAKRAFSHLAPKQALTRHTGVVVFGREYFYGGMGIQWCNPGGTMLGQPHKIQEMGDTHVSLNLFEEFLQGKQPRFRPECYDLLKHNCNSFSNEVVQFLTGHPIPDYIINLPNEALNSPFGQHLLPFLQSISGPGQSPVDQAPVGQPRVVQDTSVAKIERPKDTVTVDVEPVLLPVDLDLRLPLVMTELKGIVGELGINQKLLQQLSAASSLEADPTAAITLVVNLSQLFSCMMEPPTAAETVAKYFVIFTSSVDLMSKLTKNASDLAQLVSKLTLCSIEAGMCDNKEQVLRLVGTALANCLYHETVRAAISDQIDEVVQSTVNSYLLRSDPSIMETNSALALNVSYIPELTEDHFQELVPALLQFLQTSLESDSFSDQHALWCITALLRLLQQSPEMLEVAKVMSLDLKKIKSYPSEVLQKSCIRYENLMST